MRTQAPPRKHSTKTQRAHNFPATKIQITRECIKMDIASIESIDDYILGTLEMIFAFIYIYIRV